MTAQDRRVLVLTAVIVVAGALLFAGWWQAAGPLVFLSITAALAAGFGDDVRSGKVALGLALYAALYIALILALTALYDPTTPDPRLVLGLPAGTAVLVYLIWPLGSTVGLLYALEFRRAVLSDARLEELRRKLDSLSSR